MKVLLLAASLRKDSVNKKLIDRTAEILKKSGHEVDVALFSEFDCPLYNQEIQDKDGVAAGALDLVKRMDQADAFILSTPEYNYSIPGTLKNLIDWASRVSPMPWDGRKILLMSASPSGVGGNRGYWATRIPLEGCGAFVYPKTLSLQGAYQAFDSSGNFTDAANEGRLEKLVSAFIAWASKF